MADKRKQGAADAGASNKKAKANSKTPPAQKNNLFNYFKPLTKKNDNATTSKDSTAAEFTQVKEKPVEKVDISGEFRTTPISKWDKKPTVKLDSSSKRSESKNQTKPQPPSKSLKKVAEAPKAPVEPKKSQPLVPAAEWRPPRRPIVEALPRFDEMTRGSASNLWVDKYKPRSTKAVIGQQGDKSPMNKLLNWLRRWHQNLDKKPGFEKWASDDDGSGFRAALLSGPPGIGKTTTAVLVCKELGYDYLELNASDVQNKKSLQEDVHELLTNTKLTNYFKPASAKAARQLFINSPKLTTKHCVIMDEVDGMSGNEDCGGVAELIQLIKKTKVPIICICNDRGDQKMRSLVNYCFDLRFEQPELKQIRAALMSIAFKEQIQITPDVLNDLIASSNFDIRQCIHNLSMLGDRRTTVKEMMINSNQKNSQPIRDVKLGPFDAVKKVFCIGADYARMSFADKSDLFFADYGIMPLFVYENYSTINLASKDPTKQLKRMAQAIDAISYGEIIEQEIRTNQNWSLLPLQAAFSTVMPGAYMRSANGLGFPAFPAYMGKMSTTNKNHRLVDELVSHMTLHVTGTRTSFPLDYLQPLKDSLVNPLLQTDKAGVSSVLDMLKYYSLTMSDMDSILELGLWSGEEDRMKKVDSRTKAALIRAYNKKDFALPYSTECDIRQVTKRGAAKGTKGGAKRGKKASLVVMDEVSEEEEAADNEEDIEELMDCY